MMMGTPARPGMTRTGALSASAAAVVPIKMASASPVRICQGSRLLRTTYPKASARGVKGPGQTSGKPNAQEFTPAQLPIMALRKCQRRRAWDRTLRKHRCEDGADADRHRDHA